MLGYFLLPCFSWIVQSGFLSSPGRTPPTEGWALQHHQEEVLLAVAFLSNDSSLCQVVMKLFSTN